MEGVAVHPRRAVLLNFMPEVWAPALRAADPAMVLRIFPVLGDAAEIDCLITHRLPEGLLAELPNLRLVYGVGAGVDYLIDQLRGRSALQLARIDDAGISGDVAALAVASVLAWLRDLAPYARQQAEVRWAPLPHRSTCHTTIGLLGLGRIGCTTANALQAMGFHLCGWSRSPKTLPGIETFAGAQGLNAMLPRCDAVICTLPLTEETEGLIDVHFLSRMRRGACLVNVGRGDHVDEDALLAALDEGQLGAAYLDVFREEPLPPAHRFWQHPRVCVTPHAASRTQPVRVAAQVAENVRRLRAGEPLLNTVDTAAGY